MHELKAGCIAELVGTNSLFDSLHVHVIGPAPTSKRFKLPNGEYHVKCQPDYWILESIGFEVPIESVKGSISQKTIYCGHSKHLNPLGPESDFLQSINIDAVMDQITGGNHA